MLHRFPIAVQRAIRAARGQRDAAEGADAHAGRGTGLCAGIWMVSGVPHRFISTAAVLELMLLQLRCRSPTCNSAKFFVPCPPTCRRPTSGRKTCAARCGNKCGVPVSLPACQPHHHPECGDVCLVFLHTEGV